MIEIIMWFVMIVSLLGTILNVKADNKINPSIRLKSISFSIWIFSNIGWVIYDIYKIAYPQAFLMFLYTITAAWGLWKCIKK